MYWRINIAFLLVLSACTQEQKRETTEVVVEGNYLIEADELKKIAHRPNIKIIDFRKRNDYDKAHIAGALPMWRSDIEDDSYPYGGMMANHTKIEALFSQLGIQSNDTLVIYDDSGLCDAARLWWLLQNYDFTNVRLFHGGLNAWKENNGSISSEIPLVKKSVFKLTNTPSMKYYHSKEAMQAAMNSNTVILDTRSEDEFTGKRQKKGAAKGGRIPNSMHIDWAETIDYSGSKKFKPIQELEAIYSQLNLKKDDPIIVYCHSGVRSAHTTFVLTQLLGYKNVKNYDGSWTEWSYFNELPFEKDSLTTINN